MSCWVVPSIAAELWGCTVDAVLAAIRNGNVPSMEDAGWTFVDVAPHSPIIESPLAVRPPTPETYTVISQAEQEALDAPLEPESLPMIQPSVESEDQEEVQSEMQGDWRQIRRNVAASRRAPLAKAA